MAVAITPSWIVMRILARTQAGYGHFNYELFAAELGLTVDELIEDIEEAAEWLGYYPQLVHSSEIH